MIQLEEVQTVPAGRLTRLGAFLIDSVSMNLLSRILNRLAATSLVGYVLTMLVILGLGILQVVLLVSRGQTIGKLLLKIAIVDRFDKEPPGFVRAALIRYLPQLILSAFYPPGAAVYLLIDSVTIFTPDRRCIHDRLAGTIVIKLSAASETPAAAVTAPAVTP